MNKSLHSQAVAGSITPHLEGAARSESHPERTPVQTNSKPDKGGAEHE